jgi:hypothetical protein
MDEEEYTYPVYYASGGGLVKEETSGKYVFVEAPPHIPSLTEGDEMPEKWGVTPANSLARIAINSF